MKERFYRSLYRIRAVEERIAKVYPSDRIKSPIHLSIGQESISVGVCEALASDGSDVVFGTYRGHALYLAKGGSLRGMIAELFGKVDGCARGKGGSMHLVAPEVNMMGTSAVVATTIPHAVGYAYALALQGSKAIATVFFGDGAAEEGVFAESLNFAALHRLPVLFVCENNEYAIHTHLGRRQAVTDIARKAGAHGVPAERLDESDVERVFACAKSLVAEVRGGGGPRFMECRAYRWREHVGPGEDAHIGYRSEAELRDWQRRDPLLMIRQSLPDALCDAIAAEVEREIDDAFAFAEASPLPDPTELYAHVIAEGI